MARNKKSATTSEKDPDDPENIFDYGGSNFIASIICGSTFLFAICGAGLIYATVIVFVPADEEMRANIQGPFICTTTRSDLEVVGIQNCNWTTCHEWCLDKPPKKCKQVYVNMRREGAQVEFEGCDVSTIEKVTCPKIDSISDINCRDKREVNGTCIAKKTITKSCETDPESRFDSNQTRPTEPCERTETYEINETCKIHHCAANFDDIVVLCKNGVCQNISEEYNCHGFKTKYQDILSANEGNGFCYCGTCKEENAAPFPKFKGPCNSYVERCNSFRNDSQKRKELHCPIETGNCATCLHMCYYYRHCFNMGRLVERSMIGTRSKGHQADEQFNVATYYHCKDRFCYEIYDLKCDRLCNNTKFDLTDKTAMILEGENVVTARCSGVKIKKQAQELNHRETFGMVCDNVYLDQKSRKIHGSDCVNGTQFQQRPNYEYKEIRDGFYFPSENDLIAREDTLVFTNASLKLMVNLEGCVNNLKGDCEKMFDQVLNDGRNQTSRDVFPCYLDVDQNVAIFSYDPDRTMTLTLMTAISLISSIILSGLCLCACSAIDMKRVKLQ